MANYMTAIREIEQIVDNAPELNMNNYDEIQVDELNSAMIEICNILGNLAECESQEATNEAKAAFPLQNVMPRFDSPKNWIEDYKDGENQYICKCSDCGDYFYGYKRRTLCRQCFD